MRSIKSIIAIGLASALALLSPLSPVHADYLGAQAGGGANITYGAFAPTINGVVTQLTKSVPVDPVTGSAIFTQAIPGVADTVVKTTSVDRGAVLTTAGTAQTLVPANPNRRGLAIQNRNAPGSAYSAATSVFYSCQATATQDFHSLEVPAGALYETPTHHVGTGACSFVSGTAATPVYVREF
jgi:hypothetical protein